MALHATSLRVHKTSPSKLEKALGVIDGPLPEALLDEVDMAQLQALAQRCGVATAEALLQSLGTIGGGNHFAELQAVDTLYEEGALDRKCVHLMVHSGSRGLGAPSCASMWSASTMTAWRQQARGGLTGSSTRLPLPTPSSTAA